ncbi:MAG TPA: HD domain-containing phosphohydrolase [Gemmatimonadaceae bacterium]|nr:HD domain-containing phosphohydrolase [Gemmatimonadaceae bacterium]
MSVRHERPASTYTGAGLPVYGPAGLRPLLVACIGRALTSAPLGRRDDDVEVRRVHVLPRAGSLDAGRPTVILLDRTLLASAAGDRSALDELAGVCALVGWGDPDEDAPRDDFPHELLTSFIPGGATAGMVIAQLRGGFRHAASLVAARNARLAEGERYHELTELTRVGVALSTERDLLSLLDMILSQARRLTASDAGSIYLVEREEDGKPATLRFKLSQNHSLPNLPFTEFTVPVDHTSLSGYAAATGEPLVIPDVYLLPDDSSFKQNRSFDEKFGYRTKSMLVIPMKSHRDEIVGVLQLINRKRHPETRLAGADKVQWEVISFDRRSVELVTALASQAAVAIENSLLYEDIERLFEGFVTAAVTAIESRDPTTHGHSGRVATMSVSLAEAVDRAGRGPYSGLRFSRAQLRELRYAGLLHDFGKVGVREQVLVKEKKLYPSDLSLIEHRFAFLVQGAELEFERARAAHLLQHGSLRYDQVVRDLEARLRARRIQLERFRQAIHDANEPTILHEGQFEELQRLAEERYVDVVGEERPLLEEHELRFLSITKGNLDEDERREIESHVTHTYRFLQQIPWTPELRGIPAIAYGHHEKLNGQGYPRQVTAPQIPVQTRMMTIADIYDALTASDRPYKRAVSVPTALDILHAEAREGLLDRDLLATFVDARIYEAVHAA